MNAPLYELAGIEVVYDGRLVLAIEQLEIYQDQLLVVVGPNGAGKSTLLRLLNFLEAPSAGSLRFRGQAVPRPAPLALRRRVTTLFQRPVLLNRSVRENVVYGPRLRNQRPDADVDELLKRLDLLDLAEARAVGLSGGEAQRAALARALAINPEVLLLDEPTANLDPYNLTMVEQMIQDLRAERRCTLIAVTHNVFQARRLAERVVMLHDGELIEQASAEAFFERPQDPRSAAFVRGELVA